MNKFLVAAMVLLTTGCSVVGPGERGVSVFMGKASDDVLTPGWYLWVPFIRKVPTLSVRVQKSEATSDASSKDLQKVHTIIALNWHIDPATVGSLYRTVGNEDDVVANIISPAVSEVLKASTAKMTAEEILTKRIELKETIDHQLIARLKNYNVLVDDISIVNIDFTPEFNKAVESKQIAEQMSKQAEYEAQRAKVDAGAEVNKARGAADSALIRAKAEAEANKLKLQTLTPELIQYEATQKWDGQLPQVMGGSGGMMFNLPLTGKKAQ